MSASRCRRVKGNYLNFNLICFCEWTIAPAVSIRLLSKSIIETVSGTSILSCFVWGHFLSLFEVIQILQREKKKKEKSKRYEVNNTLRSRDSDLIEMSVERQGCQIHRICVSALSSSLSLLFCPFLRSELQLHLSA